MAETLKGLTVTVLGGDRREVLLADVLAEHGARVITVGHGHPAEPQSGKLSSYVAEAVHSSDAVIAPMHGVDEMGAVRSVADPDFRLPLDADFFAAVGPERPFFIGTARTSLRHMAEAHNVRLIAVAHIDEVAILNCIPTAEGAVQRAMEQLSITIHGCSATVVGFGRCGQTLAGLLHRMGAHTATVTRDAAQRARAYEMGVRTYAFDRLAVAVSTSDVVFNTVPARVLTWDVICGMQPESVIIDIASAPGGTDFDAAAELGIRASLELGLPGRVAPTTAGAILAEALPRLIRQHCC